MTEDLQLKLAIACLNAGAGIYLVLLLPQKGIPLQKFTLKT